MAFDWARPGVRVECINDDWSKIVAKALPTFPRKGMVLVISEVTAKTFVMDKVGLRFANWNNGRGWFTAGHFRPLVEKDQEFFRQLLEPGPGQGRENEEISSPKEKELTR